MFITIFTSYEFFILISADHFSLKFEQQQVSSAFQDFSQYSSCGPNPFSDI